MSKENETKQSNKVVTKYDLKKQKRKEAKVKEARALAVWKAVGVLILVAIIGVIAYFPIRNVYRAQKTVLTVGNYSVSQVEFDYYYNVVKNNYVNSYSSILSYMGINNESDFDTTAYSDNLTFADYFRKLAAEQLQQNAGLKDRMAAEGYTCDAEEYYDTVIAEAKEAAKTADITLKDYIKAQYGSYATAKNIKPVIIDAYSVSQYILKVQDDKTPSDEEIEAYYQENREKYDLVTYYMTTVSADLPTEPTELADADPIYLDDGTYAPSQAEIDAAMEEAKANAEFLLPTVATDGSIHIDENADNVTSSIKDWVYDSARKTGDQEIIEGNNMYYLVEFKTRKRQDETTVNARVIITNEDNGAEIMAEYEAGGANLESFMAANDKYSTGTAEDALYEDLQPSVFDEDLSAWFTDSSRKEGDVEKFYDADGFTYVVYFVSRGDELWAVNAKTDMINTIMGDYLDECADGQTITDHAGLLKYLEFEVSVSPADSTETSADETTDEQ
ncbi:MAG: hypothetical protein MJ104_04105 [Lachnospiraceae bacterium]|nr:hypothetical protein [Lachnospiraceae bacterium]